MDGVSASRIRDGDRRALARALTWAENGTAEGATLLAELGGTGTAHRVGITGAPGVGKSTLVSGLVRAWRDAEKRVGVLAVDPSSPFSGGAFLGDRIRMVEHAGDPEVYIRSLATRGSLGGLAPGVYDAADLLDASGYDPVVVETVGVGQAELEICRAADTTVLVLAPGSGDVVQGMKAGLLEAADVLVVNQSDRAGADALVEALGAALDLRDESRTRPPVLQTTAIDGGGVQELQAWLDARATGSAAELAARRRQRAVERLRAAILRRLEGRWWAEHGPAFEAAAERIASGASTTHAELAALLGDAAEDAR